MQSIKETTKKIKDELKNDLSIKLLKLEGLKWLQENILKDYKRKQVNKYLIDEIRERSPKHKNGNNSISPLYHLYRSDNDMHLINENIKGDFYKRSESINMKDGSIETFKESIKISIDNIENHDIIEIQEDLEKIDDVVEKYFINKKLLNDLEDSVTYKTRKELQNISRYMQ